MCCLLIFCGAIKSLTVGTLRETEQEQLLGQLGGSVFDTLLLATIFSHELTTAFFALLCVLMCSRSFHMIANARVEYVCRNSDLLFSVHSFSMTVDGDTT
jgi:hypothetical protein